MQAQVFGRGAGRDAQRVAEQLAADPEHLQLWMAESAGLVVAAGTLDIVDGTEKKRVVLEVCELMGIDTEQAIAVGDGAPRRRLPPPPAAGPVRRRRETTARRAAAEERMTTTRPRPRMMMMMAMPSS